MEARIFYEQVKEKASLSDENSAKEATKAVFETLHWRINEGEADDIEATLPPELQEIWRGSLGMQTARKLGRIDRMNKHQFIKRIKDRLRIEDIVETENITKAVISVLKEAIPAGETKDMLDQLPDDLRNFIEAA